MFGIPHHKKDESSFNEAEETFVDSGLEAIDDGESDPVVYGFFEDEDTRFSHRSRGLSITKAAYTSAAIIAALAVILLISRFAMSSIIKSQNKPAAPQAQQQLAADKQSEDAKDATQKQQAWEVAKVPGKNDVRELVVGHLFWDGNDVSCKQGDVDVDILGGFVQVTHTVNSVNIEPLDAKTCVTRATMRAAATSKALYAHAIKDDDGSMTPYGEVLWIVRDETGDSYLSVNYAVDGTPDTGDGIEILKHAAHYRLSDSLYADLKLTDIPQQTAEPPTGIDGSVVYSTADW